MSCREHESRLPSWRWIRWLVDPGPDVPAEIRIALVRSLYGTLPIFFGGILNTLAVSTLIAGRIQTLPFALWALAELCLALIRFPVLLIGRRAAAQGRRGPTDIYILLALLWAASVGYGAFISISSGDWVAAMLACLSGGAMVGGICFRNFAAPRLVAVMILLALGPCVLAAVLSGEAILLVTACQIPVYVFSMAVAARHLNRMLVRTMSAELENAHRASHDDLTGLLNRAGLADAVRRQEGAAGTLALFYLDLDGFKGVNDSFGHAAGDTLLAEVGKRLQALARPGDAVARVGGDEFVIAARVESRRAARLLGEAIVSAVGTLPYILGEEAAIIGASVGVALSPVNGGELTVLLRAADGALYEAKSRGRCRCVIASKPHDFARAA